MTCRCAFEACVDRAAATGAGSTGESTARHEAPRPGRGGPGEASHRFGAALEALPIRRRAALLLHDLCGLTPAQMAAASRSARKRPVRCSSAPARSSDKGSTNARRMRAPEDVGRRSKRRPVRSGSDSAATRQPAGPARSLLQALPRGDEDLGRWPVGLAVLLEPLPLPQALATPPVFGGLAEPGHVTPVAGASVLGRGIRSLAGSLRSGPLPTRSLWLAWRSPGGWLSTKAARGPSTSRRAWAGDPAGGPAGGPVCRGSTRCRRSRRAPRRPARRPASSVRCRARPSKWLRSLRVGPPPAKPRPALRRTAQTR